MCFFTLSSLEWTLQARLRTEIDRYVYVASNGTILHRLRDRVVKVFAC